ncbi:multidrug transporter [Thaumasiovibrio sp. DFM-14]|uniref:multidrug transporter n=1 Tax=Thaumasiovibrio sp. DFM-14 TaxID=3384792 RepID=UPI0039A020DF
MSAYPALIICLSALLHASWNLVGKRQGEGPAFLALATVVPGVILLPQVVVSPLATLPAMFWWLLAASGFFQVLYVVALSHAYRAGDIGTVYPLARALPVLLVALVGAALGKHLPPLVWLGLIVLTTGCLMVPLHGFKQWSWRNYVNPTCAWALLTAVGVMGYSLVDNAALAVIDKSVSTMPAMRQSLLFLALQSLTVALWLAPALALVSARQSLRKVLNQPLPVIQAGALIGITYGLVLYAMTMTENVTYVVALRQLSIPIGLVLGIFWLGERAYKPRLIGALLVCVGLVVTNSVG